MLRSCLCTAAALLIVTPAIAAPPASPTSAKPTAARAAAKPRSAKSVQCSKEADGKNLHGAARSAFMRKCNKG